MVSEQLAHGKRDRSLDGWRGVAILGVLFDHFVSPYLLNLGRFGVEMFFTLSGMLMADILFKKRTGVRTFFARRFARIYPAMAVFATVLFLVSLSTTLVEIPAQAYAGALTMTANYVSAFWQRTYAFDHLWSLCVEQHSYIVLGLVAALSRWRNVSAVGLMLCLALLAIVDGVLFTWWFGWRYNDVYWRSDVRGGSILIGAIVFLTVRGAWFRKPWISAGAFVIGLLLNINVVPDPIKYSIGTMFVAISVVTLAQAPTLFRGLFSNRVIAAIGLVSYSIYLWQEPFAEVEDPTTKMALLPVGLACGVLSYFAVETPARHALNRMARTQSAIKPI